MKYMLFVLALACEVAFAIPKFELNAGTFEVIHNRPDLKLESLWIQVGCFSPDGSRSNLENCADVTVEEKPNTDGEIKFLAASGSPNQVDTKDISIHYRERADKFFCIGMKVIFENFPNRCDEVLYSERGDRYSILSFCTIDELPANTPASARFTNRRQSTWKDFSSAFTNPIQLQLTSSDRPHWCD